MFFLAQLFSVIFCIYCLYVVVLYVFQRKILFNPKKMKAPMPENWQVEEMQTVTLITKDQLTLQCWYKKPLTSQHPTLLYCHGNAGHLGTRGGRMRFFLDQGFGLLMLSYRGYGGNEGSPSELGVYEDAQAAMIFLKNQKIALSSVILFGESLGTGVAVEMAVQYPEVLAVILQSPYTSMVKLANYYHPLLPTHWLVKDRFESDKKMPKMTKPTFIFHGEKDRVVPVAMGQALYQLIPSNQKQLMIIPCGVHADLLTLEVSDSILQFIRKWVAY